MKGAWNMSGASQKNRAFGLFLVLIAWCGVLLQCCLSLQLATRNGKSIGSGLEVFFSYFTVLTNLLICVSLTLTLTAPSSRPGKWFSRPGTVTGIATSIVFVGLSYHFLLRHVWNPQGTRLIADVLLHYVVPALYVIYWWFTASKAAITWMNPVTWSLYPTLYLVYALIRGSLIGSYPYPFIDAAAVGYGRTMRNAVGLLFVFIALGCLFVALSRRSRHHIHTGASGSQHDH
jgi:hypothetical protein